LVKPTLTLTLSRRERKSLRPLPPGEEIATPSPGGRGNRYALSRRERKSLRPLPPGEGWGEGI